MTGIKIAKVLATIAMFVALALVGSGTSGAAGRDGGNWHADIDAGFGFSQGECCFYWYYGEPTTVTAPRLGTATLTTFFIQCFGGIYVCDPEYSDLLLTFEVHGSTLMIDAYAASLGEVTTNSDGQPELDVTGTWTVLSGATGRFAGATGSGTFTLALIEPFGQDGTQHIHLEGSFSTH
jgi:hypothetical protein